MTGGYSNASCTPCDDGQFCEGLNNTAPTGDCMPGYYCQRGNKQADPNSSGIGGLCPAGRYCPGKTSIPMMCKQGELVSLNLHTKNCDVMRNVSMV